MTIRLKNDYNLIDFDGEATLNGEQFSTYVHILKIPNCSFHINIDKQKVYRIRTKTINT